MLTQTLDSSGNSALSPGLLAKRLSASDPLQMSLSGSGPFSLKRDASGNVIGVDATGNYNQDDLEQLKTMVFDQMVGGTDASNDIINNPDGATAEQRALAQELGLGQSGGAYGDSLKKLRQESLQRAGGSTLGTYLVPALQMLAGYGLGPGTSLLGESGFGVGNALTSMGGDLGISGLSSFANSSAAAPEPDGPSFDPGGEMPSNAPTGGLQQYASVDPALNGGTMNDAGPTGGGPGAPSQMGGLEQAAADGPEQLSGPAPDPVSPAPASNSPIGTDPWEQGAAESSMQNAVRGASVDGEPSTFDKILDKASSAADWMQKNKMLTMMGLGLGMGGLQLYGASQARKAALQQQQQALARQQERQAQMDSPPVYTAMQGPGISRPSFNPISLAQLKGYGQQSGEHNFFPVARGGLPTSHEPRPMGGFEQYVRGGDGGQADTVPAMLSPSEYVMDADVVSALGDGNPDAGARKLDQMRERIRSHKRSAPSSRIPPKAKDPEQYLRRAA